MSARLPRTLNRFRCSITSAAALVLCVSQAVSIGGDSPNGQQVGTTVSNTNQFENSLGMQFVPVPGCSVSFCIWETRRKDYSAFRDATKHP